MMKERGNKGREEGKNEGRKKGKKGKRKRERDCVRTNLNYLRNQIFPKC